MEKSSILDGAKRWEKMPPGAGRQLDGREDGRRCLLELVDSWTAQRDGRRCLLEPGAGRDSWTGGKRWEKMPPGAWSW